MNPPSIKVARRSVYGRILYYPDCDISHSMVAIAGMKTFTKALLNKLTREHGYKITVKDEVQEPTPNPMEKKL